MNYEPPYGTTYLRSSISSRVFHQIVSFRTLGARDFSCTVSGFGLKKWPAPSQLQPRLYQNILRRSRFRPSAELVSAALSSPSHARKDLWYPGYGFWGEIVTYQELICLVTLLTSLAQPQRRQNREKKATCYKQNNNSERTCSTLFGRFLCLHHTRLTLSNLTGKAIRSSL